MGQYPFLQTGPTLGSSFRLLISGPRQLTKAELSSVFDHVKKIAPMSNFQLVINDIQDKQDCLMGYEFTCQDGLDLATSLIHHFRQVGSEIGIDINLIPKSWLNYWPNLLVFDVDSTLIKQETIDELASFSNQREKVAEITRRAMEGDLDFTAAMLERLKLIKGLSKEEMMKVTDLLEIREDMASLIRFCHQNNIDVAFVSGGFNMVVSHLAQVLGVKHFHANELLFEDGVFTGNVKEPIVTGREKAKYMVELCKQLSIDLHDVVVIGDGANDQYMMKQARFGVGFKPKPTLERFSTIVLKYSTVEVLQKLLSWE